MSNKASIANILNSDTSNNSNHSDHKSFGSNNNRSSQTLPAISDVFSVVPISYPGGPQIQLVPNGDLANFNRANSMILNHEVLDAMSMKTAAAAEAYNMAADSWRRASQTLFEYESSFENQKPKRKYKKKLSSDSDADNSMLQPHERLKRPRNGYMIFMNEVYEETKAKNPRMKFGEISAAIGARWKNMSKREKMPYHKKHEDEKAMYESAKLAMSKSNLCIVEEKIPIQIEQKASQKASQKTSKASSKAHPQAPPPQLLTPKSPAATLKTQKPSPINNNKPQLVKNIPDGFSGDIISPSPFNGSNVPLLSTPLTPREQRSPTAPPLPSMIRKFPINKPDNTKKLDFPYRPGYINKQQNVRQSGGTVSPGPDTAIMNPQSSRNSQSNVIRIVRSDIDSISKNQSYNKGKKVDTDFNNLPNSKKKKVVGTSQPPQEMNLNRNDKKRVKLNHDEFKVSTTSTPNSSKSSRDDKDIEMNLNVNANVDGEMDDTSTHDETFYSAEEDSEFTEKTENPSSVDVNAKGDEKSIVKDSGETIKTKDRPSDVFPSTCEKPLSSSKVRSTPLKKPTDSVVPGARWYFPYVGTKTSPPGLCPFRKRKVRIDEDDDSDQE
ncbi:Nhp6ap [Gigaspora margarita]|uniref:Nhp6ap n=1 Tax=Gigaspora margarita TaxID=4874 RepID=A0A8H4AIZ5_GIGMA|nr:Nhp6ap [Gigaspora margarita]